MLGIMEEPTSQAIIHSEEESPTENETVKAKKALKLTDFFKPPPKTPVQKPVDLLGYFSSKPLPSQQHHKLKSKETDSVEGTNQNVSPRPGKGKKKGEGSTLKTGNSSEKFNNEDKGIAAASSQSEKSKVSKLSGKGKGSKTVKTKRKLKTTSPGSSADDFESPAARKPKRPKLETTKLLTGKRKVLSLSASDEEGYHHHTESNCGLPARSKDEREECKVDGQGDGQGSQQTDEIKVNLDSEITVAAASNDASGGQMLTENNLEEEGDQKNKMEVISYEDFLNSEMDVTDEGPSLSGENDGGDEMSDNESGVINDTVMFITPGKDGPEKMEVKHHECRGSKVKEEKDEITDDVIPLQHYELEKSPGSDAVADKNDDMFDDIKPLVNDVEDDVTEKSSGSDTFCGKTVSRDVNSADDGKGDNQEDESTPTKSPKMASYQSPKLLVSALVHSPQGGLSKEKFDPALAGTPKLLDRTSNVALDDLDNEISIIEVVTPPRSKPVYSIFLKNKNVKTGTTEGQKTKIKGDDRDSKKKIKSGVTENKKGASNGNDDNTVKRGRGRPRKTDTMKEKDTSKVMSGGGGDSEKKRARPRKKQNKQEIGISRKQSSVRSKVKSSPSSSSIETDSSGTRTLRPRGSTRNIVDADDACDDVEEVKNQREEKKKKKEKGHVKIPEDNCEGKKPESLAMVRNKNSRLLVKRNNHSQKPVKTNSKRAKEILKKAKSQRKPVQGLGLASQTTKRTLRVRIDPLSISDDVVKRALAMEDDTAPEDREKDKQTGKVKDKLKDTTDTTTKNKAPVKLAPMFTKEGLKYLAKKQQEADNGAEIVTLSSDDECTNDRAPSVSPFTTLAVSKKWQAKANVLEEPFTPPFPSTSHILQKDDSESTWWNIPDVDQSKLRIPLSVQTQFSPSIDWNVPLCEFTFSDEANGSSTPVKFEKHPELTSEDQKVALEEISRHNPKFPVRRIFKRYLAKRKGEIREEKKTKEGSTDKGKAETGRCSRKRKTDSEDDVTERKVRRRSLRGHTAKDEQKPKTENPEPSDILWSDKYQPISSEEVLGNAAAVKKLGGWLSEWKIKIQRIKKKEARAQRGCKAATSQDEDSESDFEPSDGGSSDSEDEGDDGICNTFLITGPHGVGKTSMVYACAKEMGFKVIEVNASSKRAGKQILEDLGEATQSHQLAGQAGLKSANLASFFKLKTPPSLAKKQAKPATPKPKIHKAFAAFVRAGQKPTDSVDSKLSGHGKKTTPKKALVKKAPKVSPKKTSPEKIKASLKANSAKSPRQIKKGLAERAKSSVSGATLILFDEVDIVFEEDKGFLSAITSFMSSTKRPIILTTSDSHFGDCLEGKFEHCALRKQDTARLVTSMQLLCLAENVVTDHQDMANHVSFHENDLRRCLHSLQTWVTTGALLPSLQRQTDASPSRRVCKLSLKRLKGTSDYSCLLKEDVQEEQTKVQKNDSDQMSKVHKKSLYSTLGCETTRSLDVILKGRHHSLSERNTSCNFVRKLLRCGVDSVRTLERSILQKTCDDCVKLVEGLEDAETEERLEATKKEDVAKIQKEMNQMSVDQLSGFADNLCVLDVIESNMTDSYSSNVDKVNGQWWGVEMYSGIETTPDERLTNWSKRQVIAELCSVLEWENYNYCRGNLDHIKSKYERMFNRKSSKEEASYPLKVAGKQSQEISNLYGIIARKLPRVNRCKHHSISLDFLPTIRSICRSEQLREAAHLKRRFLHYFDAISFHVKVTDKVQLASVMEHFVRDSSQSNTEEKETDKDEDE